MAWVNFWRRGGLLLLFAVASVSCSNAETYELRTRGTAVTVELAATPEERRVGLMHRESLPENHGMHFLFPDDATRSFWMKDTLVPLSIAYIRSDWVILEIYDMEPRSLEPVPSRNPARYALEMEQGFFEEHGIAPGVRVFPSEALLRRIENHPPR